MLASAPAAASPSRIGGEVARAAAVEAEARESAQKIRRVGQRAAQGVARGRRLDEEIERVRA